MRLLRREPRRLVSDRKHSLIAHTCTQVNKQRLLTENRIVTIQPFREEIDRVIATYVMDDAPRQLNLSARERKQLLIALSHTTHPTAFRQVAWSVESTLRMQAHPNFIRCQCSSCPSTITYPRYIA